MKNRNQMSLLMEGWRNFLNESKEAVSSIFSNSDMSRVEGTFNSRKVDSPNAAGSVFRKDVQLEEIMSADWKEVKYPGVVRDPAVAFQAKIDNVGMSGIVDLESVDPNTECKIQTGHNGYAKTSTGMPAAECVLSDVELKNVNIVTLIAGPDSEDSSKFVFWTFYPGTPDNKPSTLEGGSVGSKVESEDGVGEISMETVEEVALSNSWEKREDKRSNCEGKFVYYTTVGELRKHRDTRFSMGKYSKII